MPLIPVQISNWRKSLRILAPLIYYNDIFSKFLLLIFNLINNYKTKNMQTCIGDWPRFGAIWVFSSHVPNAQVRFTNPTSSVVVYSSFVKFFILSTSPLTVQGNFDQTWYAWLFGQGLTKLCKLKLRAGSHKGAKQVFTNLKSLGLNRLYI